MIEITSNIKTAYRNVFRLARKDHFRVVWLEEDLAYCSRRGKGHGRYVVRFEVNREGRVFVGCKSITGAKCEGEVFKGLCSHSAKVLLRGLPKGRKTKQDLEAA